MSFSFHSEDRMMPVSTMHDELNSWFETIGQFCSPPSLNAVGVNLMKVIVFVKQLWSAVVSMQMVIGALERDVKQLQIHNAELEIKIALMQSVV